MKRTRTAPYIDQTKRDEGPSSSGAFIPSGSTLLDLACSDRPFGGYAGGSIVNIVGDSTSGKTVLVLSGLAEMTYDPSFDDYRLIYNDAEAALAIDLAVMFGQAFADRLEYAHGDDDGSDVIEDFRSNFMEVLDDGRAFVYVLDTYDALTSKEEQKHIRRQTKAEQTGEDAKGSYGLDRTKMLGQILRLAKKRLRGTKSMLIIVSQTRVNIDPMSPQKLYRSGGKALKFYSSHEIWLFVSKKSKRKVNGRDVVIGAETKTKVTKNKITGKVREVVFKVYYDYGIDDVGSVVDFLVEYGYWTPEKGSIRISSSVVISRAKLIAEIEANKRKRLPWLRAHAEKAWHQFESKLKLNRRPRFEGIAS